MKKILLTFLVLTLTFSLSSCFSNTKKYDVFVTVYPLKFVAEEILQGTGYTVEIVPGVSSHQTSIDWSPKDIISMTEATYLFYVGANFDQYIDFQIDSIFKNKSVELIKIEDQTDYIQYIPGIVHYHDSNDQEVTQEVNLGLDPHFWISPLKLKQVSTLIHDKLVEKFSDKSYLMEQNYLNLVASLQLLSNAYSEVISNATKPVMTSTNIYGYLREDYGFNYFSISPGYHEESEQFTSQEKEAIVNEAVQSDIKYIVYERNTTSPLSNAVFTELENMGRNPEKLEFDILKSLTDEEISNGKNYISVMYDNLELLKLATDYVGG
jgi:zinc transport system substrate-binding protein